MLVEVSVSVHDSALFLLRAFDQVLNDLVLLGLVLCSLNGWHLYLEYMASCLCIGVDHELLALRCTAPSYLEVRKVLRLIELLNHVVIS